mmetsp:Transcript_22621/g.57691  ORF Transcript_22621/g.57691 Transcript_22621/m.57691 type:complete len:239 (+) Transcript_22621:851-1567(+)
MPRLTRAKRPGWKALPPSASARSMSMVPVTRSSVAPSGSSTKGVLLNSVSRSSPALKRARTSSLMQPTSSGFELYLSPLTHSMSGSRRTRPRTAVDLPVPRSPWISTPPITGSTKFSRRASLHWSWPTTPEKGKTARSSRLSNSALRTKREERRAWRRLRAAVAIGAAAAAAKAVAAAAVELDQPGEAVVAGRCRPVARRPVYSAGGAATPGVACGTRNAGADMVKKGGDPLQARGKG